MTITYLGHSCFKLKGKRGTVILDPYSAKVGFPFPTTSADVVTISHDHYDHNFSSGISGTARRPQPFLITQAGEYEVGGISVFGITTHHDDKSGTERGINIVYTVLIDELRICHLGDLGHLLSNEQIEEIGEVDVLLCPVGGEVTIDSATAVKVIHQLEPSIVIPMHYKTSQHSSDFANLQSLANFTQAYGMEPMPVGKLELSSAQLPEETELMVLVEHATGS